MNLQYFIKDFHVLKCDIAVKIFHTLAIFINCSINSWIHIYLITKKCIINNCIYIHMYIFVSNNVHIIQKDKVIILLDLLSRDKHEDWI